MKEMINDVKDDQIEIVVRDQGMSVCEREESSKERASFFRRSHRKLSYCINVKLAA